MEKAKSKFSEAEMEYVKRQTAFFFAVWSVPLPCGWQMKKYIERKIESK